MKFILISSVLLLSLNTYACISGIFQAKAQGLSQQLQIEQQTTNKFIELADQRFNAIKDTRNSLLKSWIAYIETKNKEERATASTPIKIREAEFEYKSDLLKLKRECRDKANEEQTAADASIAANNVTTNPTRVSGTRNRQRDEFRRSLDICMADPIMRDSIRLAHQKMDNAILGINKTKEDSLAAIQVLHKKTIAIQNNALTTRGEAFANLDYKENLIRQMQAKALSVTRQVASLQQTGAALQCVMQAVQSAAGGSSSSN